MAVVSMSYLLEAGVHFGHQTKRWNPKMKEYIFTARDDIYIIDLQKTVKKLEEAYEELTKIATGGGKVIFVGTKKQASESAKECALRTNMYYVTERWLGGTLTNFKTIRSRVKRLEELEKMSTDGTYDLLPKKEVALLNKEYEKLNKYLCGIREMKELPKAMIIVDPSKEYNAIREARKLNIPVFGIVDTNCDPDMVDYVIPGNDDAVRAVKVVLNALTNAIATVNGNEIVDVISEDGKRDMPPVTLNDVVREERELNRHEDDKHDHGKKDKKKSFKKDNFKKEEKKSEIKEETKKEEKVEVKEEVKEEPKEEVKKETKEVKEDLSSLSLTELKNIAKERGIKGYSKLKKDELLEALK